MRALFPLVSFLMCSSSSGFYPVPSTFACGGQLLPRRSCSGEHLCVRQASAHTSETSVGSHVAAASLRERGFAVIAEPIVDVELVAQARALTQERLVRLLSEVQAAGCSALDQQYRFKEIVHRQRNRWDLQLLKYPLPSRAAETLSSERSTLEQLSQAALSIASPIIKQAQGALPDIDIEPLVVGAVVSRPGAGVQRFHCDVAQEFFASAKEDPSQRLYNLFMPLVDLSDCGDGTEFWPGPSLDDSLGLLADHFLACETGAFPSPLKSEDLQAPACCAGGLVIFDYRTIHRCS